MSINSSYGCGVLMISPMKSTLLSGIRPCPFYTYFYWHVHFLLLLTFLSKIVDHSHCLLLIGWINLEKFDSCYLVVLIGDKFSVKKLSPISVIDMDNFSLTLVLYDPKFPLMLFTFLHTSKCFEILSFSFEKGHLLTLLSGP